MINSPISRGIISEQVTCMIMHTATYHLFPCTASYHLLHVRSKKYRGPFVTRLEHLWQIQLAILSPGDHQLQQKLSRGRWSGGQLLQWTFCSITDAHTTHTYLAYVQIAHTLTYKYINTETNPHTCMHMCKSTWIHVCNT